MLQVATSLSRVNIANIFLEVYHQFYSKKKNSDFTKHPTNMTFSKFFNVDILDQRLPVEKQCVIFINKSCLQDES